ncbi:hypothetical protein AAFF_G00087460 [Aldrovandia affinis]|uniref:RNA polymerase II subunit M n=1 Tax=Aldrovandia affinis TaxID=143900 RepID=A0AAD7WCK5_9TELE|nr:hypothetical protein AAFF_G00087460 [Aldrovandia affinis]
MSSSWTERQGHIGDLQSKSKAELCEILLRQEKLLSNKRFVQSLPDKGSKISDLVHRVRIALAHHEEEEAKRDMLSSVRAEFQSKYQQALSQRQPANRMDATPTLESVKKQVSSSRASPAQGDVACNDTDGFGASAVASSTWTASGDGGVGARVPVTCDGTEDYGDLADALGKVTLSEDAVGPSRPSAAEARDKQQQQQLQKKSHYIEILHKTEMNLTTNRPRFKPNQLARKSNGSTPSSSSPARRQRDLKHLDDITAAKLPPLHHSPALLLSLDESAALQQEQNRKQEELQAKMAALKLSERLGASEMRSYSPEGGLVAGYREVHDNGTQLSSEED